MAEIPKVAGGLVLMNFMSKCVCIFTAWLVAQKWIVQFWVLILKHLNRHGQRVKANAEWKRDGMCRRFYQMDR